MFTPFIPTTTIVCMLVQSAQVCVPFLCLVYSPPHQPMDTTDHLLPLGSGEVEWWAVRQRRNTRYGIGKRLVSDVVLFKKKPGQARQMMGIYTSKTKGGRHWLKVKVAGKSWYWHRLVAWCFGNPRNFTWSTFHRLDRPGQYKWQAGHLNLEETDCTASNLKVMTRLQHLRMYRCHAKDNHGTVYTGSRTA